MTDRELLEAAARAAGIKFSWINGRGAREDRKPGIMQPYVQWNPLESDGDALRLAVKLRITPHIDSNMTEAEAATEADGGFFSEAHLGDPYAATRRAIVRAAAAMADWEA